MEEKINVYGNKRIYEVSLYTDFITNKKPKLLMFLMFGLLIAGVSLFASLADEVHEGDTLGFDRAVLLAINGQSSPFLDTLFSVGTDMGGAIVIAAGSIALITYLSIKRLYSKALLVSIIIGGSTLANLFLKLFFERSRPELWQRIVQEESFSFPSGHAMASMALALTLVFLAWNTRWRFIVIAASLAYVLFIGFSRLYLGVHYPTDIIAGWLVSCLWVAGVIWLYCKYSRSSQK